jgi:hypothetical protein
LLTVSFLLRGLEQNSFYSDHKDPIVFLEVERMFVCCLFVRWGVGVEAFPCLIIFDFKIIDVRSNWTARFQTRQIFGNVAVVILNTGEFWGSAGYALGSSKVLYLVFEGRRLGLSGVVRSLFGSAGRRRFTLTTCS